MQRVSSKGGEAERRRVAVVRVEWGREDMA